MSVVSSSRPQIPKIVPISGSNKPLYANTRFIKGNGVFQKDNLSRKLYSGGKDKLPIILPTVNEIPLRPITQLGKSQQFAIEFMQGKDIYDQRKTFSDNLSKNNNNPPVYHLQETMTQHPDMPPQLSVTNRPVQSIGSLPPRSIVPVNTAIDNAAVQNISSEGAVEPMETLHQDIPPALRQLRSPTVSSIPNYTAAHTATYQPATGIDPHVANEDVFNLYRTQPDAPLPPNASFFPTQRGDLSVLERTRPTPMSLIPPHIWQPANGWRGELENSVDTNDALASLNIAFQNLTVQNPVTPRVELQRPTFGTSNLHNDMTDRNIGAFPVTPIAPNLSIIPQATEGHLGTPINQASPVRNAMNGNSNHIVYTRPVENPESMDSVQHTQARQTLSDPRRASPTLDSPRPTATIPDLFTRRRNARWNARNEIAQNRDTIIEEPSPPLRRSTRNRREPDRLRYDANGNQIR